MGEKGNTTDAAAAVGTVEKVGQEAGGVVHAVGVGVTTAVVTDTAKEHLARRNDDDAEADPDAS
jgi:hypothetical protein